MIDILPYDRASKSYAHCSRTFLMIRQFFSALVSPHVRLTVQYIHPYRTSASITGAANTTLRCNDQQRYWDTFLFRLAVLASFRCWIKGAPELQSSCSTIPFVSFGLV